MTGGTAQIARAAAETAATARTAEGRPGARAATAPRPTLRRLLVTAGVAGSLIVAGATVRAASQWASTQAPLDVAPVSVESVESALALEKSRAAVLEDQIANLHASAAGLQTALEAAQSRLVTDEATADELRASLAAAQEKLAKLEAALVAQGNARTSTRTASADSDDHGDDDDHDRDDDDEHDDDD